MSTQSLFIQETFPAPPIINAVVKRKRTEKFC